MSSCDEATANGSPGTVSLSVGGTIANTCIIIIITCNQCTYTLQNSAVQYLWILWMNKPKE